MTKNTAQKGARFERALLTLAIAKGASFATRGASSKSRSPDKYLKVDAIVVKGGTIYFIQAKNHKRRASAKEKERFANAVEDSIGSVLDVQPAYIESQEELERLIA